MGRSPARVSIVMLDERRCTAVSGTLRRAGFEVDCSDDQKTAVTRLIDAPPDVLLLDRYTSDGEDVLERLSALRLELRTTDASVLLMASEPPSLEDQKLALEIGPVSFLDERYDEREIFTALRHALTTRQPELPVSTTSQVQVLFDEDWQSDRETPESDRSESAADDRQKTVPPFPGYQERLVGREKVLSQLRRLLEPDFRREPDSAPLDFREDVVTPQRSKEARKRPRSLDENNGDIQRQQAKADTGAEAADGQERWSWQEYESESLRRQKIRAEGESTPADHGCSEAEAQEIIAGFFDEEE